jgi:outer membrane protein
MNAPLWRNGALALSLALLPAALAAQAAPPALTLDQAVRTARENNPDFLSTANDLRSSRAAVKQARWDLLPTASASTGFGYTAAGEVRQGSVQLASGEPVVYSSSYQLQANYTLSGSKLFAPTVARAQEHATAQRIVGSEANLVSNVVQEYLSVLQAQEEQEQAEHEVARTAEHVRLAQARLQVGAGTPLDLRSAQVQKGQADVKLVQQQAALETERLRLGQLMGVPLAPGTRLTSQFQLFEPAWSADSLVPIALRNNPNLLAARASASAAETQIRSARTSYLPSMSLYVTQTGYAQHLGNENGLYQQALASAQTSATLCQRDNMLNQSVGLPQKQCIDPTSEAYQTGLRNTISDQNGKYPFHYARQPWQAGLSFSLPIFTGASRSRQVEEARVAAQDASLATRSLELKLQADIAAATLSLHTAYRTAELQEEVRQQAAEQLRLAQERFRYGAANSVDVTDAEANLDQAERAKINAVYAFHKSLAALEALIGQPLR